MKQHLLSRPREEHRRRPEAGETLLEVLIASTLMAIAVVAILGGLGTMLTSSSLHRDQAKANTVLVAAMENVKSDEVPRVSCTSNPAATYLTEARTAPLPDGWTVSQINITGIAYQTPPSGGVAGFSTNAAQCSDTLPLQRITITVTSPDGRVNPSLTFVKGSF